MTVSVTGPSACAGVFFLSWAIEKTDVDRRCGKDSKMSGLWQNLLEVNRLHLSNGYTWRSEQ
jgi:hypothetical protein